MISGRGRDQPGPLPVLEAFAKGLFHGLDRDQSWRPVDKRSCTEAAPVHASPRELDQGHLVIGLRKIA